jgi:hypothetical protein
MVSQGLLSYYGLCFTSPVLTPELGLERDKLQGSAIVFVSSGKPGLSAHGWPLLNDG